MEKETTDKEIKKCVSFIFQQLRRGYSWKEAKNQAITSYGYYIKSCAEYHIQRYFMKI